MLKGDILEKVFTNLTNGGPVLVYVQDGKIVRVRPLRLDRYRRRLPGR